MKRITTVSLDEELVEQAKALGLNISRTCEVGLEEAVKKLSG